MAVAAFTFQHPYHLLKLLNKIITLNTPIKMLRKLHTCLVGTVLLLASCKKDIGSAATEAVSSNPISITQRNKSIQDLFSIGKTVGQLSVSSNFKQAVYSEVGKRFDGDDNVLIKTLLDDPIAMQNARISNEQQQVLRQTVNRLQTGTVTKHYPQIYIPYFEELQNRRKGNSGGANLRTSGGEEPIVYVFWDGKETANDQYPGYVMNANGELEKLPDPISDEYAKQHEVWVLSFNERMVYKFAKPQPSRSNLRTSDYRELVYQLKTDNLGTIEGWPAGDLEMFLSCASPAFKLYEGYLPSISRSSVKDKKWATVDFFIFYWYVDNHGKMIGLDWTEKDAGGENDETITYSVPANNGLPGVSYSYNIGSNDEHCVYQIVQFDDPAYPEFIVPTVHSTIYGNHLLNWTMKSIP